MNGKGPLIKICGITNGPDAATCIANGVDFIGFIFHPKSPRNVEPAFPASIKTDRLLKVGVFVNQTADEVNEIMDKGGLDLAQLHGRQDENFCREVGKDRVIKVLWPDGYESREKFQADLDRFSPTCRFLLFDSGKSGGGHGTAIDFANLQHFDIKKIWFIAGGINLDNVDQVLGLSPNGLDINSGIEAYPGIKDENKLKQILAKIRA